MADYPGLEQYIVQEARNQISSRATAPSSYEMVVEDYDNGTHHVYELLCLLPPAVIRSLIANTLPFDIIHDPDVKRFFDAHMAIKKADPCAGVYVQWMSHAPGTVMSHAGADKEGKFLSANQVAQMLGLVEGYLDNKPTSQAVNDGIDRAFNPKWHSSMERARTISDDALPKARDWVRIVRQQYCTGIDPAKMDSAFLRVPMEVGWAQDIAKRIKGHNSAGDTPPLLYLINAIRQTVSQGLSFIKQEAFLFPVPFEEDTPLYKIAEILGSILCSSYHFHGGYNTDLGGKFDAPTYGEDHSVWCNSEAAYLSRLKWGHVGSGLRHVHDQFENLTAARNLPAMRAEHAKEKAAYNERKQEVHQEVETYKQVRKEEGRLQGEYDQAKAEAATRTTGLAANWLSLPNSERVNRAYQRQRVWEYLDMDESVEEEFAEAVAEEIEAFDEVLVDEVIKAHSEASARVRQETEDARERLRKEKEK